VGNPSLSQAPLFGFRCHGAARTNPNPDLPLESDRRKVRGHDFHDGHFAGAVGKGEFVYLDGGDGQDISVGAHLTQRQQQLVSDFQADRLAPVVNANQQKAGLAMIREVVSERACGNTELLHVAHRLRAFDAVGFQVGHQGQQFLLGQHVRTR
jgi:hypothetical protein